MEKRKTIKEMEDEIISLKASKVNIALGLFGLLWSEDTIRIKELETKKAKIDIQVQEIEAEINTMKYQSK